MPDDDRPTPPVPFAEEHARFREFATRRDPPPEPGALREALRTSSG